MTTIRRLTRLVEAAPDEALKDALAAIALCFVVFVGFSATSLV